MIQKVTRELVDDLDDSPAAATVRFGYDGRDYETELSKEHAAEFDEFLAPYLEYARRVGDGGLPDQDCDQQLRSWFGAGAVAVLARLLPAITLGAAELGPAGHIGTYDHLGGALRPTTQPQHPPPPPLPPKVLTPIDIWDIRGGL